MLADLNPCNIGGDRTKLAANLDWGIHFEVEHILVRGTTRQINHDHRFIGTTNLVLGLGTKQLGHREPTKTKCTDLQKITTRETVTETTGGIAVNGKHQFWFLRVRGDGSDSKPA